MFAAWISSGLDPDRLAAKLGRLLGQLTGRASSGRDDDRGGRGKKKAKESEAMKRVKRLKGGVRGVFEAVDKDAEGTVSQHHMKVRLVKRGAVHASRVDTFSTSARRSSINQILRFMMIQIFLMQMHSPLSYGL